MYCLTNICYVCLKEKGKSLIDINSSLSVNEDIIHILGDLPFNLGWMKTKRVILICEECCRRLRETYQLLTMCLKNSAVMQGYIDRLNTGSISTTDNEAELRVNLVNTQGDIDKIKCEIKSEDEEIYTFESGPIFEETEAMFENVEDLFVKEEDAWKIKAEVDEEEPRMENNSTENRDNETDLEIAENSNTHDTDTDSDSSEFTPTQRHTTNKKKLTTPDEKSHKCLTCGKSFTRKGHLQIHTRVHTGEKPYKCSRCKLCFRDKSHLVNHMRKHTGERPYQCTVCKNSFIQRSVLKRHMRTHNRLKLFDCAICNKSFKRKHSLLYHMQAHTGAKPSK